MFIDPLQISRPLLEIFGYVDCFIDYNYNKLSNAKPNLLKDLPTDISCDWINKRNVELNKIPLCKT